MKVASQLKHVVERRGAVFLLERRGTERQPLSLLEAVYFDNTKRAKAIIEADPSQINQQDPFAGLTPLHIAIFRQNIEIVRTLVSHPRTDPNIEDGFHRKPIDICVYTVDEEIYSLVVMRSFVAGVSALPKYEARLRLFE